MGRLHQINQKIQPFANNVKVNIALAIEANETKLVNMNKRNLLESKDSAGKPLVHRSTGSQFLTLSYARRANKLKPNLFFKGDFQKEMFLHVDENALKFFLSSEDWKASILAFNYGDDIFGIPKERTPEAKRLNLLTFTDLFKRKVLQK